MMRALLLLAALPTLVRADKPSGVFGCGDQWDCIRFTEPEEILVLPCDVPEECVYEVCLQISYDGGCAVKTSQGQTFSHWCYHGGPGDGPCALDLTDPEYSWGENQDSPGQHALDCQIGRVGQELHFVLKHKRCAAEGDTSQQSYEDDRCPSCEIQCRDSLTFFGSEDDVNTCSGNPGGFECIWTYTLPESCAAAGPPPGPGPEDGCPKGKGVCWVIGECHNCIMGSAKNKVFIPNPIPDDLLAVVLTADGAFTGRCLATTWVGDELVPLPEAGQDLSNAVVGYPGCVKGEAYEVGDGTITLDPPVQVLDTTTPFTMKCGSTIFFFGDWVEGEDFMCTDR